MRARTVALLLAGGLPSEQTVTALGLAERLLSRGARVTVFAHGDAAAVAAGDDDLARAVAALIHRGLHGATLDWVVDQDGVAGAGSAPLVPGAVPGDHADLWAFVRAGDLVLSAGGQV